MAQRTTAVALKFISGSNSKTKSRAGAMGGSCDGGIDVGANFFN